MKLQGILNAYEEAKKKNILTYLGTPTKGSLHKCLIDFINSNYYDKSYDSTILGYFQRLKSIGDVLFGSKEDDFKAMASLLKGSTTSYNRTGLLPLLKILLEFDIRFSLETIRAIREVNWVESTEVDLEKQLIKAYTEKPLFTEIYINGDINNKVGPLSMEDYYIQLSYISHRDIQNRKTLIYLEKESSSSKIKNYHRTFYASDFSEGHISKTILLNDKIIITGNPGIGKSTYARWLCYNWAKKYQKKYNSSLLIYIQLRDLDFASEEYLESYINKKYLNYNNQKISSLDSISDFQLVLDGFDELSFQDKTTLSKKIKSYKYIVLSRPYGLIQHDLNYDYAAQIDGFDRNCIENYINKTIQTKAKRIELKRLIHQNQVLYDYASTPLILSYMTLIFTISPNANKTLSSTKSIYDLQEKVFDQILNYEEKKGSLDKESFYRMKERICEFAYLMLKNKQFSYSGNLYNSYQEVAEFLSKVGLGSQNKIREDTLDWRFSFNTVTFQEFLAAQHFENKTLNHKAFTYLLSDSFFWNFCIMFVGMLSQNRLISSYDKEANLSQILDYTYQLYSKDTTSSFYGYAYYMLLSECSQPTINKLIKTKDLNSMTVFYQNIFFDPFWNSAIHKSIQKIILKLNDPLVDIYVNILENLILEIPKIASEKKFRFQKQLFLGDLIEIGLPYNEQKISKSVVSVVQFLNKTISDSLSSADKMLEDYSEEEIIYNEKVSNKFDHLIDKGNWAREASATLAETLTWISEKQLLEYKKELLDIYNKEPSQFFYKEIISKLYVNYNDEELLKKYGTLIREKASTSNKPKKIFKKTFNLLKYLFVLIHNQENSILLTREKLFDIITFLSNYAVKESNSKINEKIIESGYINYLLEIIVKSDNSKLYVKIYEILAAYNVSFPYHLPDEEAYIQYVNFSFKRVFNHLDKYLVENLILTLEETPNTRVAFFQFRENLFKLFQLILKKDHLQTSKDIWNQQQTLRKIASIPKDNLEKKIFINYFFIDSDHLKNNIELKQIVLKEISTNLLFYEEKYWNLFVTLFDETLWDLQIVLPFLTNEDLFLFKSNHSKIMNVFVKVFNHEENFSSDKLYVESFEVILIITKILFHLKYYPEKEKEPLLRIIERILCDEHIIEVHTASIDDITEADVLLAFILFYYYNPVQEQVLAKVDFDYNISMEVGAKEHILEVLIEFVDNPTEGIQMSEIEIFKTVLGDRLYNELVTIIEQRLINNGPFNPRQFEVLLAQTSE